MVKLLSPADGARLSLLKDAEREFVRLTQDELLQNEEDYAPFAALRESSYAIGEPAVAMFRWWCDDPSAATRFELSINEDFSACDGLGGIATIGPVCASAEAHNEYFVCVDNLLRNTMYYWRVNGGDCRRFTTADETRLLRIDGCGNIRDLGGGKTADGRRIKQGYIYRGCCLEKGYSQFGLTDRGMDEMKNTLAIRTEIDLRGDMFGTLSASPLGEQVAYELLPTAAYRGVFHPTIVEDHIRPKADIPCQMEGFAAFCRIFELLADKASYPVYFHCTAGADRTGTLAMLINAVLGVSCEDLYVDYALTRSYYGKIWDAMQPADFFAGLHERYPDRPLNEQMVALLMEMGITADTLQCVRDNLIE